MKVYPKVPRHDHGVVPDAFFETGQFHVLEKLDGGNFRFTLYEERFEDEYPDVLLDAEHSMNRFDEMPADGDVVFGTKKLVRGTSADDIDRFDGELRRAVRALRQIDREGIRRVQDEHGPVTFFAENMALHTLDYGYGDDPPPALLGFDICAHRKTEQLSRPPNPFDQTFQGFIEFTEVTDIFERIGVSPVETVSNGLVDVTDVEPDLEVYEFPQSAYADVTVEGVVFRKPGDERRVKLVRPEFQELNREKWGLAESQAENGNELFVARYCTLARVNKELNKMVVDEGRELSMGVIEDLWRRVYEDIWKEEWRDIMDANFEFNPSEVKPLVAGVCRGVVERRVKNAELNDADPLETFSP